MEGLSLATQFYGLSKPVILFEGQQLKVFAGSESAQVKGHGVPGAGGGAPGGGSPEAAVSLGTVCRGAPREMLQLTVEGGKGELAEEGGMNSKRSTDEDCS